MFHLKPSQVQPGDGLKHLNLYLPMSPESGACRGVLSGCTHRASPLETPRARVLVEGASSQRCGGQPCSARLTATRVPCVTPWQPAVCHCSAVLRHLQTEEGESLSTQNLGYKLHLNAIAPLGHPLSPSELWLLEAVGWFFSSSNVGTRRAGCWALAESLGKRKGSKGLQWVNGKEVTPLSSVSLITGHLSTSPQAHPIPRQAQCYPTASCCKLFPEQV